METKRSSFTGKIGFVLAAAGSAVGLGNIWRFPYLAAKYGGGIFLLVYLILAVTFGYALMCAEIAIGRKTGKSAIEAFASLNRKYKFVGVLASIVPIIVLPYYSVIGGWVTKYLVKIASGGIGDTAATALDVVTGKPVTYFDTFTANTWEPIGYFLIFLCITALVVLFGVEKGIEKVSRWMMPVLIVLTIGIAVYSMTLPGAIDGVKYYILPDFSQFSVNTVLGAMGQLFYSMSLAMGIMITYGSYMKKDISIENSVSQIEIFDTGVAFLAGLMVIPAVFSFSGSTSAVNAGPGLMFETLPQVFNNIGATGGSIVGGIFFLMVLFAALTSSISLMETVVSIFRDKFGWGRKTTCFVVFVLCIVLGLPSSLGFGILEGIKLMGLSIFDTFDFMANSIIMPLVALLTCFVIGYVIKTDSIEEEIELCGTFKRRKLFRVMIKYVAPIFIVLILISSVLDAFDIVNI